MNEPVEAKTMVIEGWVEDYALKNALELYKRDHYKHLIITGLPLVHFEDYVMFPSTAAAAAAVVRKLGFKDSIYEAVIPKTVFIDRTYNTGVATRMIMSKHPDWGRSFNIYSVGVHSRRTHLMFERAFGSDYNIGIIADTDHSFDPEHWWHTSIGFRNVSNEFVAWIYVSAFFHPTYSDFKRKLEIGYYTDSINKERKEEDAFFADSAKSPLEKDSLKDFHGLSWYPIKYKYRVMAKFDLDTVNPVFEMATNTARKPEYRIYGHVIFKIHDTLCKLTVYQNINLKNDPQWGNYLFIPFRDKTNGFTTHAAGRYLDIEKPVSDSVIVDFNKAYNPYCAYADRWSCPLVPIENRLPVAIKAGVKEYK
ncbi:MAG: DUF1684 domain-containing protein [Bacteroidales bacterium]|nr:DUF1684 domain-containing protein [Bacteroidales bacterium]